MQTLKIVTHETYLLGPGDHDESDAIPIEVRIIIDQERIPVSLSFRIGEGNLVTCAPEDIERISKALGDLRYRSFKTCDSVCADHGYYNGFGACPVCERAQNVREAADILRAAGGEFT